MLNSLAAYLLGGAVDPQYPAEENATGHQMRLTSVEVDDWLLVDKELPSDSEESDDSPAGRLTDSEGEQRASPPPLLVPSHLAHRHGGRSKQASRSPSQSPVRPGLMDESWFVTPPPCFTSQGPGELETGPLENLLIEHPSMSVYQRSGRYSTLESLELADDSTLSDGAISSDEAPDRHQQTRGSDTSRVDGRSARAASINRMQQREEQKSSKKLQKARQPLKRGALERNNKAREVNTRNARRRRADHAQAQRNSRANNNRKCC